jgi:hypothetical protein
VKKFDKTSMITVKMSMSEARQKLVIKKGIDFRRRKIIAIPVSK